MRTKDQIENLRLVMTNIYGSPLVNMLSDVEVNFWANCMQKRLDSQYKSDWVLKVRIQGDKRPWEEIPTENKTLSTSLATIQQAVCNILEKFPEIESIQLIECLHDPIRDVNPMIEVIERPEKLP